MLEEWAVALSCLKPGLRIGAWKIKPKQLWSKKVLDHCHFKGLNGPPCITDLLLLLHTLYGLREGTVIAQVTLY